MKKEKFGLCIENNEFETIREQNYQARFDNLIHFLGSKTRKDKIFIYKIWELKLKKSLKSLIQK